MHATNKPSWSLIISSTLGTFLEFFDYTLYAYFAVVISHEFFPLYSSKIQFLATWSVFAIGCLVRPLGALAFGHFADRIGRKKILPYTILLMALPTVGIGLLPTYESWGWLAPALLLLCRMVQGLSISAEYNGCSVYCVENRWARPGFLASLTPFSCGLGMLGASLLALSSSHNWRLPFIVAGTVVGIVGWVMRRNLPETTEFEILQREEKIQQFPLRTIVQHHKFSVFVNIICSAYMGTASYLLLVYMPSYLQREFSLSINQSLQFTVLLTCLEASACLLFGWLSDKIEQWKTMMLACMATLFICFLMLFISDSFALFLLCVVFLAVCLGAFDGPLTSYLPKLVPTSLRYSATSFGYNIGGAAIGGMGPIVVTFFIQQTHAPKMVLISYLAIWAFLAVILLVFRNLTITVKKASLVSN